MTKETKIIIKMIENPDNPDVGIKYVGAKDYATPKVSRDGKVVTGIDEFSLEIMALEEKEQKKKSAEVKKIRESLEKLLGKDLTPESSFWNEFFLVLEDGFTLDPLNPRDQMIERFLIANRYVAPSREDIDNGDERYENCFFYFFREEEEVSRTAKKQMDIDRATAKLFLLHEENPNKLKIIASYLFGFDARMEISIEEAYIRLKDFIEDNGDKDNKTKKNQSKNIDSFLKACEKTPEEMMVKQILDRAVKKRLVTARGGIYKRDDEVYGSSFEEAVEFLALPEHSGELASLRKAVDR